MSGRSGQLRIGGETATVMRGEPVHPQDLQAVLDGLYRGGTPTLVEQQVHASKVPNRLGLEIWKAISRLADKTQMRGTARNAIEPGPLFRRLSAFPMESETMALLARVESGTVRVGDTVRLDKPTRLAVLDDLARLRLLTVIQIGAADSPLKGTRSPPPTPRRERGTRPARPAQRRSSGRDGDLVGRLGRELENIESLDDWSAVGCNPSMAPDQIEAQCLRMVGRYSAIIRDRSQSQEVRDLAREIGDIVSAASDRIRSGSAKRDVTGVNPKTAYDDGVRLAAQGRWEEAVKAFGLAQQHEPYAPQHTAWLGYAFYMDPSRDLTERQRKGKKLIEKAVMMGVGNGDPHYVQARLLVDERDLVRAWNHVEVCLRANPAHAAATALRDSIQREIKRDN